MKQVKWTKKVLETFIEEGCLSPVDEQIMRTRIKGWTQTKQSMELGLSMSALNEHIKNLKLLYDAVQKEHPDTMPVRKKSKQEMAQDSWPDPVIVPHYDDPDYWDEYTPE